MAGLPRDAEVWGDPPRLFDRPPQGFTQNSATSRGVSVDHASPRVETATLSIMVTVLVGNVLGCSRAQDQLFSIAELESLLSEQK